MASPLQPPRGPARTVVDSLPDFFAMEDRPRSAVPQPILTCASNHSGRDQSLTVFADRIESHSSGVLVGVVATALITAWTLTRSNDALAVTIVGALTLQVTMPLASESILRSVLQTLRADVDQSLAD